MVVGGREKYPGELRDCGLLLTGGATLLNVLYSEVQRCLDNGG